MGGTGLRRHPGTLLGILGVAVILAVVGWPDGLPWLVLAIVLLVLGPQLAFCPVKTSE